MMIGAALVNNVILARFLGLCSFMGVTTRVDTAAGMGLATTFVITVSSMADWAVQTYLLDAYNLGFLRTQAERIDPRLIEVWPRETKAERARFEKLKDAYVKARYSKHYRITEGELAWLGERVTALGEVVETICEERIAELERTSRVA
jgi:hypothetical protein